MPIDLKYQSVSEAFKILEAKIDAIIEKLDKIEADSEEDGDPYVTPGSDCQV